MNRWSNEFRVAALWFVFAESRSTFEIRKRLFAFRRNFFKTRSTKRGTSSRNNAFKSKRKRSFSNDRKYFIEFPRWNNRSLRENIFQTTDYSKDEEETNGSFQIRPTNFQRKSILKEQKVNFCRRKEKENNSSSFRSGKRSLLPRGRPPFAELRAGPPTIASALSFVVRTERHNR